MGEVEAVVEAIHVDFPLAEVIRAEIFRVRVIHLGERHTHGDFLPRVAIRLRRTLEHAKRVIPPPSVDVGAADTVHQRRVKLILQLRTRHERGHLPVHVHLGGGRHAPLIFGGRLVTDHVEDLGVVEFGERPKLLLRRHHRSGRHDNNPF